jgi:hypothetical protein
MSKNIEELVRDAVKSDHRPSMSTKMVMSLVRTAISRLDYIVGEMTPLDPSIVEIHNVIDDLKLALNKISKLEI